MARPVSPVENANKMEPGGQDGTFDKKKPVKEPCISIGNCEGEDVSSGVPVLTDLPTQENNNYKQRSETCSSGRHSAASPTARVG